MIQPNASTTQAVRAVFIIDPEAKIRTILYYPQSTGRNMQEIKRIVMALQKNAAEKVATPANWQPGDDVIIPAPSSMVAVKERAGNSEENMYCLDWFLCLKKDSKK
jgi:peroxiredoxin (alkyl hydroperoxide reductase subunit C)